MQSGQVVRFRGTYSNISGDKMSKLINSIKAIDLKIFGLFAQICYMLSTLASDIGFDSWRESFRLFPMQNSGPIVDKLLNTFYKFKINIMFRWNPLRYKSLYL